MSRPQSCSSTRSWSSGKAHRAPPPPPPRTPPAGTPDAHIESTQQASDSESDDETRSNYSQDSYTYYRPQETSCAQFKQGHGGGRYKDRVRLFAQEQWLDFREDSRKQKTCAMWSCFLLFVMTTIICMTAFLSSVGGPMKVQ